MELTKLPLVVLAGGDLASRRLPPGVPGRRLAAHQHSAIALNSKPLLHELIERLRSCGWFFPLVVCGPESQMEALPDDCILVDTNSDLVTNALSGWSAARPFSVDGRVGFTCSDYLPTLEDLEAARKSYCEAPVESAFWFALIRPPERVACGTDVYLEKRRYVLRNRRFGSVLAYPGHLLVIRWEDIDHRLARIGVNALYGARASGTILRALRTSLACLPAIVGGALERRKIGFLRIVFRNAISLVRGLVGGRLDEDEVANGISEIFVTGALPRFSGRISVLQAWSLACDVDTEEEAAALACRERARLSYAADGELETSWQPVDTTGPDAQS